MSKVKEPQRKKLHVKKGDRVMLLKDITAYEDRLSRRKGYVGKVLRVFPATERIIIEGVNMRVRHTKANQQYPNGGRIEREMPIHASNVLPVDGNGQATRVGRKRIVDAETGKGRWVRYAKSTGEELDR